MWSSTFHRWNGDELNKNDLNGEILKDGLVLSGVLVGYRTFYDYFEHIINGKWWKKIGRVSGVGGNNQLNILRYIVTVYDRMEKIGLGSETGTIVNGEGSSVTNDDLIKDIVDETYLEKELVESIVSELLDKKQIVLQGPPGTGKTFVAKKIAECMKRHGFGDEGLVQFHASYSYEEFMEGYKPESGSDGQLKFKIKNGIFKEFCLPPVMNTLELGDLYTRNELSDLFKLNDKANLHRYLGQGYEDRYKQFKKGGKHGSISFTGVFCYDERFDLNDNSIWLFVVEKKEQERQPSFEDFYDRKTGVLNWQTQEKQKMLVMTNLFIMKKSLVKSMCFMLLKITNRRNMNSLVNLVIMVTLPSSVNLQNLYLIKNNSLRKKVFS
uniref:5-methylcytosine-specific restriction enzyme B n=1 Tax=uncultured marine thaumarchaeote AD1000_02_C08 TaxID=1455880 RepID=A0A075FKP8_9ARCH|nr:5-methylcytosine-specific restriction enzyme B [uncultured marine thaumarchaeote AD1000_02_C08]